jgi:hypothetical protein
MWDVFKSLHCTLSCLVSIFIEIYLAEGYPLGPVNVASLVIEGMVVEIQWEATIL